MVGGNRQITSPDRRHYAELDFIRMVAIFCVVILHSASPVLYQIGSVPRSVWITHNAIDAAMRVCVPLFFMVSGFLLLAPQATDQNPLLEVGRRLRRIGLPLLAWTVIYLVGNAQFNGAPITLAFLASTITGAFQGAAVYHLWFIYELGVLYLLMPVLRPLVAGRSTLGFYFVGLWLALALWKLTGQFTGLNNWPGNFLNLGNSGYLFAGYLIRLHLATPSRGVAAAAAMVYAGCTVTIALLTAQRSYAAATFDETFYVYSTFLVIVQSISAFIVLMRLAQALEHAPKGLRTAISSISAVSFGIYFIHVIILEHTQYNVMGEASQTPLAAAAAIVLTAIFATAIAYVCAWALKRLRLTRWLVS